MLWACTHAPWRALKFPLYICRTILCRIYVDPYIGGARCSVQSCPPTPYGRSQLLEAAWHIGEAPPLSEMVSHKRRTRSTRFLPMCTKSKGKFSSAERTSASTNLSSSFTELCCILSESAFEKLILNVAQPFNQIPLTCWTRSLPSSRNAEALNKEHFQQSRPRLKT